MSASETTEAWIGAMTKGATDIERGAAGLARTAEQTAKRLRKPDKIEALESYRRSIALAELHARNARGYIAKLAKRTQQPPHVPASGSLSGH